MRSVSALVSKNVRRRTVRVRANEQAAGFDCGDWRAVYRPGHVRDSGECVLARARAGVGAWDGGRTAGSSASEHRDLIWVFGTELLAVVAGVFLLRGRNWARWLLVAWMGFHVALSALHPGHELAVHGLLTAVVVYFLFRAPASEFFRGEERGGRKSQWSAKPQAAGAASGGRDDGGRLAVEAGESLEEFEFGAAADHQRRALVDRRGLDVEDPPLAVERDAAGLFGDEGDGVGFVQQPQLAVGVRLAWADRGRRRRGAACGGSRPPASRCSGASTCGRCRRCAGASGSLGTRRETCPSRRRSTSRCCLRLGMRMFSWLSTYSPTVGSSVKPWTPWPVRVDHDRGRAVDDVAGGELLGAALQDGVGRHRRSGRPSGRAKIEKIVPTLTLTSMFDEPSSGSKSTMYLPGPERPSNVIGSSFSSEAMMATFSRTPRQWISALLA